MNVNVLYHLIFVHCTEPLSYLCQLQQKACLRAPQHLNHTSGSVAMHMQQNSVIQWLSDHCWRQLLLACSILVKHTARGDIPSYTDWICNVVQYLRKLRQNIMWISMTFSVMTGSFVLPVIVIEYWPNHPPLSLDGVLILYYW